MKALLIPVKDPSNGKTRLAGLLNADERARLAWAMFEDVARAACLAEQTDCVVLVSSYQPAITRARRLGWEVLVENDQVSESASIDWASGVLEASAADTVMRLPADLPLVRGDDIDYLFQIGLGGRGAVLVASRDLTGTNAIVRTPPTLFPSRFGPDSLALHKAEALRVGVELIVVSNERIAVDIDEPSDLEVLLDLGAGTESHRLVEAMKIKERVTERTPLDAA